jgi:DNA-binding NarL/FixJ family response regulator
VRITTNPESLALTSTTGGESHHRDVVPDADFVARICSLSADASTALERQFIVPACPSAVDIQQTLSRMWNATIAKLLHVVAIGAVPHQHAGLAALLLRIRDADIELAEARIVHRTELLRRACAALAGLDRALLPTIRDSTHNTKHSAQLNDTTVASNSPSAAARRAHPVLSVREVEVIELLAAGASNRRIARKLMIAEGTVKTHVTHILRKLGAANRAEAVAYWLRGTLPR